MFNQCVLHRPLINGNLDWGLLAETLLFYNDVLILLDRNTLQRAAINGGLDRLTRLHEEFGLKLSYHRETFGTLTNETNGIKNHRLSSFKVGGQGNAKVITAHDEMDEVLGRLLGQGRRAKKSAKKIIKITSESSMSDSESECIADACTLEIAEPSFLALYGEEILRSCCPGAPLNRDWYFRIQALGKEFALDTNIDFVELNKFYEAVPSQRGGKLTGPLLTTYFLSAHAEAHYASKYMSSYVTDPLSSSIMQKSFAALVRRKNIDTRDISLFQENFLGNAGKIKETINGDDAAFDEFLRILKAGYRFKEWLRTANPDETLMKEYYRAVTASTWIDRLPTKILRWTVAGGLGAVLTSSFVAGTATAIGLSAMDSLIFERLLRGWRPNQFVEGPLKNFTN